MRLHTELAHRYKDKGVRFVGVDVHERDTKLVMPFVEKMGANMDYGVALDSVPEKGEPKEGVMARTWMKAAEEHGRGVRAAEGSPGGTSLVAFSIARVRPIGNQRL